ncbi:hypothetical protein HDF26_005228 [Pedobacter cryoconitis]|uniref:Uncharacterized protein n=1 Tax=Pedobacter cryoconitis TaxID=188932 RepID=A0A7W8ZMZ5_9SPHI|nr:hypothetical protein [Pedobacter cryoconitis]MBB5636752.1 hypothetical protein [Pedobacter cryoconitis]MBB6274746.1 hypothetical protein [Pedobacter cryoconitis]
MKTRGLQLALIAAVSLIVWLSFKLFKLAPQPASQNETRSPALIDEAKTAAKILATAVDQKGYTKVTLERKAAIIGDGDISKLPISKSVMDSLRLDNLDKTKKLQQASLINANLKVTAQRATSIIDSLQKKHYVYHDDYLTASFSLDTTGGTFDINYQIKLLRQDYAKRKNWFSPYVQYTDILSPDKRISINGMQSLTITAPKPSRFGLSLLAGYYYNPFKGQFSPGLGLGLSYNLVEF